MSEKNEDRRTTWPICPSVVSAFVLGLLVSYVLSAGPMSESRLSMDHPGIYGAIYQPLYCVTDRIPDPIFDAFNRYVSIFGDVPNLSFMISREHQNGHFSCCIMFDPPPDNQP